MWRDKVRRADDPPHQPAVIQATGSRPRRFKPYPAYKDSGVEWTDNIPEGWCVKPLKRAVTLNPDVLPEETAPDFTFRYIDISSVDSEGRISEGEILPFSRAPSRARRRVLMGDCVISTVRTYLKAIGRVGRDAPELVFSTGFAVLRSNENLNSDFLFYALQAEPFIQRVVAHSEGVGYPAIAPSELGRLLIVLPGLHEQRVIATFLDRETAKIDALVAKKELVIDLLEEERAALVNGIIIRGLNPNVPKKDSGVEWLGQIPAHWKTKRLKFVVRPIEQGWSPACENRPAEIDEWGVLKVGCVNGAEFDPNEQKALPAAMEPLQSLEIQTGDILVSRANTRELLGSAALVRRVRPRLLLCDKLYRMRVAPGCADPEFLVMFLGSRIARFQLERDATGASGSMQNIGQDTVENLLLPLPPMAEQSAIRERLTTETARIDGLIAKIREAIARLHEHRIALISATVAGKIDVRDVPGKAGSALEAGVKDQRLNG